jgi:hypothetical protein
VPLFDRNLYLKFSAMSHNVTCVSHQIGRNSRNLKKSATCAKRGGAIILDDIFFLFFFLCKIKGFSSSVFIFCVKISVTQTAQKKSWVWNLYLNVISCFSLNSFFLVFCKIKINIQWTEEKLAIKIFLNFPVFPFERPLVQLYLSNAIIDFLR